MYEKNVLPVGFMNKLVFSGKTFRHLHFQIHTTDN